MLETLANLGEFVGAIGVIVTIGYLAVQIKHNTKAVRSSSYHQAAEQTWTACFAMSQSPDLAAISVKMQEGKPVSPEEAFRVGAWDSALLFGFENMLRLHEEGLVDDEVFRNVIDNSLFYLASPRVQEVLKGRPGPLSGRLVISAAERAKELGITDFSQPNAGAPNRGRAG